MEPKKCPHCQKENLVVETEAEIENYRNEASDSDFAVICNYKTGGCGATGGFRVSQEDAILAWNHGTRRDTVNPVTNPDE